MNYGVRDDARDLESDPVRDASRLCVTVALLLRGQSSVATSQVPVFVVQPRGSLQLRGETTHECSAICAKQGGNEWCW